MTFPEKLYSLRKSRGESQEQLAEALGVSRQAISKWETGAAVPETDKLLLISRRFGVTVDSLLKDEEDPTAPAVATAAADDASAVPEKKKSSPRGVAGIVLLAVGIAVALILVIIAISSPEATNRISASSFIEIDGFGIALILCVADLVLSLFLLLKKR